MIPTETAPTPGAIGDRAFIDCEGLLAQGARLDYVEEAQARGLCLEPQVTPITNSVSQGAGLPWVLIVGAVVAAVTLGLEKASSHGAQRRREAYALTGGHIRQATLGAASATGEYGASQDIQRIHMDSDSKSAAPESPQFEPTPWGTLTPPVMDFQRDRIASDLSTEACWKHLKNCTVTEFQDKVGAGDIDPVSVENGAGTPIAREACNSWFAHDICEIGKVGWAVFGSDGQGGTARARATSVLVKRFRDEYHAISRG